MPKPKIAFFTPLTPVRSGISDYSEELLPSLRDFFDLDIVTEGCNTDGSPAARLFRIIDARTFLDSRSQYDAAVYQIANSFDHHAYMLPCMEAMPGVLALHDCCLQYLVLGLTARQGRLDALERVLAGRYGSEARRLARRLVLNLEDPAPLHFAGPFVRMSRGVIVHSRLAFDFVRSCGDKPVAITPMGVPSSDAQPDVRGLRRKYGYGEDDFILLSVSTLSKTKRIDVMIRALAEVRKTVHGARLLIVGGGSLGDYARELIQQLQLQGAVSQTGWVDRAQYNEYIAMGDVALDVRYPSGGETSASLARAFAAGKPAIVSAQQTFMEIPDDVAVKIPVAPEEVRRISAAILRFARDEAALRHSSAAARQYAQANCSLARSAKVYAEFIERCGNEPVDPSAVTCFHTSHSTLTRSAIATMYKLSRVAYLYRSYGFADTWRRVREELAVAHA